MIAIEYDKLTDEEREQLVRVWYQDQVAKPAPPPPPEPEKPKVETFDVDRPMPLDIRLVYWLDGLLSFGSRDGVHSDTGHRLWLWRRAVVAALRAWPRFRHLLWIVRSGPTTDEVYETRWAVCDGCESLRIGVRNGEAYCGACGCPDWALSKLRRKNRYRFNHCPRRRHAGGYLTLARHRYPNRSARKPGGCGARNNGDNGIHGR